LNIRLIFLFRFRKSTHGYLCSSPSPSPFFPHSLLTCFFSQPTFFISQRKPRKIRKIYRIDQKKLEFSIQMSNYSSNSCTYYSSINSLHEDLSKKLRSNSLITNKRSCPRNNNWISIMNSLNEDRKETELMIEDLNFRRSKRKL